MNLLLTPHCIYELKKTDKLLYSITTSLQEASNIFININRNTCK